VTFTLQELAAMSDGELLGDPAQKIDGVASLAEAMPGEITFFADPRYLGLIRRTQASAVFVSRDFSESIAPAVIRVENPARAFQQILLKFAPKPISFPPGVHPTALVDPSVKLGARVSIQPYAVIEAGTVIGNDSVIGAGTYVGHETIIGDQTMIYANVTIRERTRIGSRVIIHGGVVIGADGFGFEVVDGRYTKVPQIGIVQIDNDVEIGANTTIDRARFGRTWIQEGVKIDNLVQVAHNVVIGQHSAIAAGTGIAGSVRIGKNVMIAGQAGLVGHIEIADGTIIGAQAGVTKSISGGAWLLSPAVPLAAAKQHQAWIHRLGKLIDRVKAIERKLGQ
jgi:UDP-3-O-[3-hydroxymyristoyl] glucosamine N-acyltransferase